MYQICLRRLAPSRPESGGHHEEVLTLQPQRRKQLVDRTVVHAEKLFHHAHDDNNRKKIGHVRDRLHHFFEFRVAQLVEQQRQENRRGEGKNQTLHAENYRIGDYAPAERIAEERLEMFQPHPLRAEKAALGRVILKSDHNAVHGQIFEKNQIDQPRNQHHVQHPVESDIFPRRHIPANRPGALQKILPVSHLLRHLASLLPVCRSVLSRPIIRYDPSILSILFFLLSCVFLYQFT